jgi:hypothetical protein
MTPVFQGRLKVVLMLAFLAGGFSLYIFAEWAFNLNSNAILYTLETSRAQLEVRLKDGSWKPLADTSAAELQGALRARPTRPGMSWRKLPVRRQGGLLASLLQRVYGAEVNVITISPDHFDFTVTYRENFELTTARERLEAENLHFSINANFHEPSGAPMGWVWHHGRQVNKPFGDWSGVFFVKNGRPWFGPKSLLDDVPGPIQEGAQVYPSVMKNHTVFNYVMDAPDRFFDGQKITYRSLAGVRQSGEVVFVLSGDGGFMNVAEVTALAHLLGVQHATLMDGGKALQYSIRTEDGPRHFTAYNTRIPFKRSLLAPRRSPVFIAVRPRPPVIRAGKPVDP